MLWLNLVHLYQPANIEKEKVEEATEKSYERLLRVLEENPNFKLTANIAGSLLDRWATEFKRRDLLERLKGVIQSGQLEVVGTAAYHALLPLVSKIEAITQIKEQERLLEEHLGVKQPKGFYLPELAYSPEIAKVIKKLGYEWIVVDEITALGRIGDAPTDIFIDRNSGLKVIVRNRKISESYIPSVLLKLADSRTYITVTDAEIYGLRHVDHAAELETLIKSENNRTSTFSEYISKAEIKSKLKLVASSWQTTGKELENNIPYALWSGKKNKIHAMLWELADMAQDLHYSNKKNENFWWSRWHLWRGLQSCSWWWSSNYDFREVFGPLAWSPDEVERAVNELLRSIRSLEKSTDIGTKLKAEKLGQKIRQEVWRTHWLRNN